jgi:PTH2 family peptidyl-tRNA hydrolase
MGNYNVKQVIVLRKDLNMRKGKMVAQGAHASMAAILKYGWFDLTKEKGENEFHLTMTPDVEEWLEGNFAKICVSADSEEELLALYKAAQQADMPCSLIQDAGFTEFNGVPTYTAVAIGPAQATEIDKITGNLKLL